MLTWLCFEVVETDTGCKCLMWHVDHSWMVHHLTCCCHKELWDSINFFPFVLRGPLYPMLKEVWEAAPKHLSLAFREFQQLSSWLPLSRSKWDYLSIFSSVLQLPGLLCPLLTCHSHHIYWSTSFTPCQIITLPSASCASPLFLPDVSACLTFCLFVDFGFLPDPY